MENNSQSAANSQDTTLAALIRLVYQWKKLILILTGLSLVASIIIAFFVLPVYYKSTAIFYPLNSKAYDPRFMDEPASYELYGSGEDADRVLSIGNSSIIREYITVKYKLANRYDIDTTSAEGKFNLRKKFEGNFDLKENERGALELSFYDQSADTAAVIVNDILDKINEINLSPTIASNKTNAQTHLEISIDHYNLVDSMATNLKGKTDAEGKLAEEMISMEKFNDLSLQRQLKRKLEMLNQKPTTLFVIEKARADFKKARPLRMVIVALSVIGTFIFALTLAAIAENIKALKEKEMI